MNTSFLPRAALPRAICAAITLLPLVTVAQDTAPQEEGSAQLDRITVTGSNISGVDLAEALPITVIDREDIEGSGADTVSEILAESPLTSGGTGTFSESTSGTLTLDTPVGASGISLRGLGTASTLVLVNGRRIAASSFANGSENFVDVNAIPLSAIERIEILPSGASAIYGADAVAGVINFILRDDFDGLELSSFIRTSDADSDETSANINLLWGHSTERSNTMVVFDYYERNALYDRDRSITANEPRPSQQGIYPSFNDLFALPIDLVESSCSDQQRYDGREGFPLSRFGEFCEINRNAFTATIGETERVGVTGTHTLELGRGLTWFTEAYYQDNYSVGNSSPAPWSGEAIAFDHPGMPASLRTRLIEEGADPGFDIFGWGRFPDARTVEVDTQAWRLVSGLSGAVGQWQWEAAFNYSKSESTQRAIAGIYNVEKFRAGLLGELCPDGSTDCSADADGLFYDPFNGQRGNSAQVLDLVRESVPRRGESELWGLDARISGALWDVGGGAVMSAFGLEYRHEDIRDNPDPLARADASNGFEVPVYGFGLTQAQADRDAVALYGELYVPLTESFSTQLALRYDDYDDFGSDVNPKVGFRWQPVDNLVLRGSYSQSFRAPSLAQTGAGLTLSSGALPCSEASEFFDNFCDGFAEDDFYLSEITGNPDLDAETADSYGLGFVWNLTADTTLEVDYWRYEHENLVDIDAEELFRRALSDPSLVVEEGMLGLGQIGIETRDGTIGSPVEEVHLALINVGFQETDGVDLSLTHYLDAGDNGSFRFLFDATYVASFDRQESAGGIIEELAGAFRYPEWLATAGARWYRGSWTTDLAYHFTDSYQDDLEVAGVLPTDRVDSWGVVDLRLSYDFANRSYVTLAVDNLLDEDAPRAQGSSANVDLFNHNTLGRTFKLAYTYPLR